MLDTQNPTTADAKAIGFRFGLIGGIIAVVYSLVRYLISIDVYLDIAWSMASYLIVIAFMIAGAWSVRKAQQGFIPFKQALQTTFLVGVVSLILWGGFAFGLAKYYDPNISKFTKNKTLTFTEKVMEMSGANEEEIEIQLDQIEKQNFEQTFGQFTLGLFGQFFVAFIYALVISAFFSLASKPATNPYPTE